MPNWKNLNAEERKEEMRRRRVAAGKNKLNPNGTIESLIEQQHELEQQTQQVKERLQAKLQELGLEWRSQ